MSKDGSAGGGTNINLDDLLAMNPELMEQLATEPEPVAAPTPFYGTGTEISQPDQTYFDTFASPTENFYGSGTEITQPDADYYDQFPLPGQAPAQTQAPRTSTPIPIFDIEESSFDNTAGIGGEGGAGGMTYDPVIFADGAQRGPVNSAPVYGRRGINPAMPILDAAEDEEEIAYYTPRFNNFNIGAM
tara:strand:+ start:190 stop:753 length:564 start_codon:yes stop_codon:yes gene_type:complete